MIILEENFNNIIIESVGDKDKKIFLSGIFMESEQQNRNGRIYKNSEITQAVKKINEAASTGRHILGQLDHPDGSLEIKLDEVSHKLLEMKMDGNNAIGKAEILTNVPKGQIAKGLIDAGVQLGVSSRGTGAVQESTGIVEGFDIVTVDLVAAPSAINAYPQSIYESVQLARNGHLVTELSEAVIHDPINQKYFRKEIEKFIQEIYKQK